MYYVVVICMGFVIILCTIYYVVVICMGFVIILCTIYYVVVICMGFVIILCTIYYVVVICMGFVLIFLLGTGPAQAQPAHTRPKPDVFNIFFSPGPRNLVEARPGLGSKAKLGP